jgi:L-asparagine transporter-like permease
LNTCSPEKMRKFEAASKSQAEAILMNIFITLAVVGLIFSVFVNIALILIDKYVALYWAVYPFWICVFIFGYLIHKYRKDSDDHHHH